MKGQPFTWRNYSLLLFFYLLTVLNVHGGISNSTLTHRNTRSNEIEQLTDVSLDDNSPSPPQAVVDIESNLYLNTVGPL